MRLTLLILDLFIITFTWFSSCYLVMGPQSLRVYFFSSYIILPALYFVKIFFFARFGLYNAILRYAGFPFARAIVKAVTFGSLLVCIVITSLSQSYPIGVLVMGWLLPLFLVGGSRFFPRYYSQISTQGPGERKRALIYGAGDLGEAVARSLLKQQDYLPVGFIDDDERKIGKKLHNLPILGNNANLSQIIKKN